MREPFSICIFLLNWSSLENITNEQFNMFGKHGVMCLMETFICQTHICAGCSVRHCIIRSMTLEGHSGSWDIFILEYQHIF